MSTTVSRINTIDGSIDQPDHEISLFDTTAPPASTSRTESPAREQKELSRKPTRETIRERLAHRKYAKWQENRLSKNASNITNETNQEAEQPEEQAQDASVAEPAETEAVDFADRGRQPKKKKKRKQESEIDVLYENQRGSFFLGIPLYSHSSLLNFDPAPWVTKDFKDSAVNVTNAQVPDPSWEWDWKRWYVDMSHDVDEEGWQYSFMFGKKFSWHGTHPWFHSFCRRRRWLRKRVKRHSHALAGTEKAETMSTAHNLNTDYFTIHPMRNRSPDSKRPDSYTSGPTSLLLDEPPEDIKDIATLLHGLRLATVDREKIDIVKKFIDQGGEELAYLGSHIPDIMSSLVFQNSRTQLLSFLKEKIDAVRAHRDEHGAEDRPEGDEERRRIDNLLAAVKAADEQVGALEYWSDRKHVLQTVETSESLPRMSTIFDNDVIEPKREDNPAAGIKGISSKAEVDIDPTHELVHTVREGDAHDYQDKGKGKEKETHVTSEQRRESSPPRLKPDQLFIPDED